MMIVSTPIGTSIAGRIRSGNTGITETIVVNNSKSIIMFILLCKTSLEEQRSIMDHTFVLCTKRTMIIEPT